MLKISVAQIFLRTQGSQQPHPKIALFFDSCCRTKIPAAHLKRAHRVIRFGKTTVLIPSNPRVTKRFRAIILCDDLHNKQVSAFSGLWTFQKQPI